jgi:hypothetical protein
MQEKCFSLILVLSAGKKRYTANLKQIRHDYEQDTLRQQINVDDNNRFRYLYHKRRANGDVLSSVSLFLTSERIYFNDIPVKINVYSSLSMSDKLSMNQY